MEKVLDKEVHQLYRADCASFYTPSSTSSPRDVSSAPALKYPSRELTTADAGGGGASAVGHSSRSGGASARNYVETHNLYWNDGRTKKAFRFVI